MPSVRTSSGPALDSTAIASSKRSSRSWSLSSGDENHAVFQASAQRMVRRSMRGSFAATSTGYPPRRRWREHGVRDGVIAAVKRHALAANQRDNDLERFLEPADAMVRGKRRTPRTPDRATPHPIRARAAPLATVSSVAAMFAITLGLLNELQRTRWSELHPRSHGGYSAEQRPGVVHPVDGAVRHPRQEGGPRSTRSRGPVVSAVSAIARTSLPRRRCGRPAHPCRRPAA